MQKFITVEEAQAQILSDVQLVASEVRMISEACGRVLAETVLAPEASPPFDNSAMDGYAVQFDGIATNASYPIVGESAAGRPFDGTVEAGAAIRIMTGAEVPSSCDTVIVREDAIVSEESVSFSSLPPHGANIRRRGSSMAEHELVLDVGAVLDGAALGLLASFQRATTTVFRRPVVAVLATGDELVEVGAARGPGQIVNSNAYMLRALLSQEGCEPLVFPIVPDDKRATRRAFENAIASADLVVSVGGVSVGDYDWVKTILDELCEGMNFWKIRMKPGKPLAFGRAGKVPLIGLPGNPVSAFVCFHQFVAPLLRMMRGQKRRDALMQRMTASLAEPIHSTPKRRHYVAGVLSFDPAPLFTPYHDHSSGNLRSIIGINALGVVEEGISRLERDAAVEVDVLR